MALGGALADRAGLGRIPTSRSGENARPAHRQLSDAPVYDVPAPLQVRAPIVSEWLIGQAPFAARATHRALIDKLDGRDARVATRQNADRGYLTGALRFIDRYQEAIMSLIKNPS